MKVFYIHITVFFQPDNKPICPVDMYQATVSEDAVKGTPLLIVKAEDSDTISQPKYYLIGPGSSMFIIDKDKGELYVDSELDRENHAEYLLKVEAREVDQPGWKCSSNVRISVTDINDNPPVFDKSSYIITVPENSPHHTLALIHAPDPDYGKVLQCYLIVNLFKIN